MELEQTSLPGVVAITPKRFGDDRGYFSETFNKRNLDQVIAGVDFVQDNESLSAAPGTVRGLHYQAPPHAQDKLVRVLSGAIVDVAVDARVGSPHYGSWVAVELSSSNGKQLFVPKGFLHGFATLTPDTLIAYKCSDYYAPEADGAVRFDSCGIDWGMDLNGAVLSGKDEAAPEFSDWSSPFEYGGAV